MRARTGPTIPQTKYSVVSGSLANLDKKELRVLSIDPGAKNMGIALETRTRSSLDPRYCAYIGTTIKKGTFECLNEDNHYTLFAEIRETLLEIADPRELDLVIVEKQYKVSELNVAIMSFIVGLYTIYDCVIVLINPKMKARALGLTGKITRPELKKWSRDKCHELADRRKDTRLTEQLAYLDVEYDCADATTQIEALAVLIGLPLTKPGV